METKTKTVRLAPGLAGALVNLARNAAPHEACGFLAGPAPLDPSRPMVDRLIVVANAEAASDRFRIAPIDFMRAQMRARARGHRLLGVFHGHPSSGPVPSEEDLAAAAVFGEDQRRVDLIAGRQGGAEGEEAGWVLAAWSLGPSGVRRLPWFEEGELQSESAS